MLHHDGKTSHGTIVGGAITLLMRILIASYLIMRIIALNNYDDPSITSYRISEDRN